MKLVNVACGFRYNKEWLNLDFHANSDLVRQCNILSGLPFDAGTVDAVYSSHFVEHLTMCQADSFIKECKRVLKSGGILRFVVPDLENIARTYLNCLEMAKKGKDLDKLEFVLLEFFDQMVRQQSGGELGKYYADLKSNDLKMRQFIKERTGERLEGIVPHIKKITLNKLKNKMLYIYLWIVKRLIPKNIREIIIDNTSIGEKHKWIYDEVQLLALFERNGFTNIKKMSCSESDIPNFNRYFLDVNQDGSPYKGVESLYMEAKKA